MATPAHRPAAPGGADSQRARTGDTYLQVNTAKHQTPRTSRHPQDEFLNGQVLAVPAGGDP